MERIGILVAVGWVVLAVLATPRPAFGASGSAVSDGDAFMPLDPLQVTVVVRGRPRGLMIVDLGLEIPEARMRSRVRSGLPRLRDHMLRSMTLFAATAIDFTRPVDVRRLAGRLQIVADAYAGDETIQVYLVNVTLQKR